MKSIEEGWDKFAEMTHIRKNTEMWSVARTAFFVGAIHLLSQVLTLSRNKDMGTKEIESILGEMMAEHVRQQGSSGLV